MRRALVAAVVLLLLAPGTSMASSAVSHATLDYLGGIRQSFVDEPAELVRLGVASLAEYDALVIHREIPVHGLDPGFWTPGDLRTVGEAATPSDLWWVIMAAGDEPKLVVSVQMPGPTGGAQGVGLNWVPPDELDLAMAEFAANDPRAVLIPEHTSVVVGIRDDVEWVMPVVNDFAAEQLGLERIPTLGPAYAAMLREYQAQALELWQGAPEPGAGGGGAVGGGTGLLSSPSSVSAAVPPGMIALGVMFAIVGGGWAVSHFRKPRRQRRASK